VFNKENDYVKEIKSNQVRQEDIHLDHSCSKIVLKMNIHNKQYVLILLNQFCSLHMLYLSAVKDLVIDVLKKKKKNDSDENKDQLIFSVRLLLSLRSLYLTRTKRKEIYNSLSSHSLDCVITRQRIWSVVFSSIHTHVSMMGTKEKQIELYFSIDNKYSEL
jgi:hypothetical protein